MSNSAAAEVESASLQVGVTRVGNRTVLTPEAPLTHENCGELASKVEEVSKGHKPETILELKRVPLMDSAALEMLLDLHEALRQRGGALKIIGATDVCRDILLVTRLIHVLHVYDDLNQAVSAGGR
jgi:anti-anti-sigma factor